MYDVVTELVERVSSWEGVSAGPHRFGGVEFALGKAEIGHVHRAGWVDILYSQAIRERLVAEGKASLHHILPETGWISFVVRDENDLERAVWLFRLSYLQKAVRQRRDVTWDDPAIQRELDDLSLSEGLRSALTRQPAQRTARSGAVRA